MAILEYVLVVGMEALHLQQPMERFYSQIGDNILVILLEAVPVQLLVVPVRHGDELPELSALPVHAAG